MTVDALAAPRGADGLVDPRDLGVDWTHLDIDAGAQILLRTGARSIRLAVRSGTFLEGPVRLRYALEGLHDLDHQLLTLRRIVGLHRLGRWPAILFPRDPRAGHWIKLVRVLDALDDGASQRDMADALFGRHVTHADWRGRSDYLRLRVQRLVRAALRLRDRDYLDLLRGAPPL